MAVQHRRGPATGDAGAEQPEVQTPKSVQARADQAITRSRPLDAEPVTQTRPAQDPQEDVHQAAQHRRNGADQGHRRQDRDRTQTAAPPTSTAAVGIPNRPRTSAAVVDSPTSISDAAKERARGSSARRESSIWSTKAQTLPGRYLPSRPTRKICPAVDRRHVVVQLAQHGLPRLDVRPDRGHGDQEAAAMVQTFSEAKVWRTSGHSRMTA